MSTIKLSAKGGGDFFRLRFWAAALLLLGMMFMLGMGEAHAAPLAGTSIGNQASASYTDANNVARVTVSNTVTTIVAPVGGLTLTQSQTKNGAPGQPLAYPHTITNTGNSPDTYTLAVSAPTGTSITGTPQFFADSNCDGIADNSTPITTVGPVAPTAQACFVAQATLTTTAGATGSFIVTATSGIALTTPQSNTDTANIVTAGTVNISKSISSASGPAGTTPVTYTLTYRNTGSQPVFGLVVADSLQAGVVFAGTLNAKLNNTPITANGTVTGTTPNRANLALSSDNRKIVLVIERVDPNTQGTFSFDTTQNGPGPTNNNNAQFCYLDGTSQPTTPYAPGTLPTTIQPPNAGGTATVAAACIAIIGNATAANGSGVLSAAGTAAANYTTATSGVIDTNVVNATAGTNPNVTNTVPFTILTTAATGALILNDGTSGGGGNNGVAAAGNPTDGSNPAAVPTGLGDTADVNVVASATQGSVVTFGNFVWNTGTASDTYNVTAVTNNFPAGTSFIFFRADGTTPLTDSDGDGVPDTGPIPGTGSGAACPNFTGRPNATAGVATPCATRVVVAATLPSNASGTALEVIIRASSSLTPATTNSVADRLTAIVGSQVDVRNPSGISLTTSGGGTGVLPSVGCSSQQITPFQGTCSAYQTNGGTGQSLTGEANPVTSIAANPGTQVRFKLDVVNTGAVADSFDLSYNVGSGNWNFNGSTNPFATPQALPAGYTLAFYFDAGVVGSTDNCSTVNSGAQITNTGVLQPPPAAAIANHKLVCAVVTIPANAASGAVDLYFRALSPTTTTANTAGNSFDVKHDQLFINTVRSVAITPNNSGQVFPGGSVSYCHTVTNVGNVIEPSIKVFDANSLGSPWSSSSTLYLDTNGNCTLDGTEGTVPINGASSAGATVTNLAAGASVNYIVVVQAPAAATAGQTNITTVTAAASGVVNTVAAPAAATATDTTVVVTGQVSLVKTQALDPTGSACSTAMSVGGVGALNYTQGQITQAGIPEPTPASAAVLPLPGNCIVYHVVATNVGTQNVTAVIISDSTPPNTTCLGAPFSSNAGAVTVSPAASACVLATTAAASLATTGVTLAPNATVDLYMRVKIAP